jgi:branched-chain amino acid transport system ATP-binding protein
MAQLARSTHRQKLEIRNVSVTFQGLVAVQDVSETLLSGEILGLIGPNGAGKTTLVNAVTGFQTLGDGDVLLEGVSIARLPPQRIRRRGIARTFQAGRLFHTMTVLENVELAAFSAGQTRRAASEQAHNILAWIGLSAVEAMPTAALPYSDERRVGIARALAGEPAFVLLDEPAAGMSDLECDRLIETIRDIPRKFGSGVLIIEHNVRLVTTVSERIHVLDSGRTIARGAPEIVRYDPAVIKAYIGEGRNHAA